MRPIRYVCTLYAVAGGGGGEGVAKAVAASSLKGLSF